MNRCKELFIVFICLSVIVALAFGAARIPYQPSGAAEGTGQGTVLLSSQILWNTLDTTSVTGTEPTNIAANERTYATVVAAIATASSGDDEISYAQIPASWNGIRFRCLGYDDNGVVVYEIYFGTLGGGSDCELAYAGQLTFGIGQQASTVSSYEMAHSAAAVASDWEKAWGVVSPSGERVATASIDLLGADLIVAVPSATDTNSVLLMKGY